MNRFQRLVRAVPRRRRNVLNEFANGDTVRPRVVRREETGFHFFGEALFGRHFRRGAREDVQALEHNPLQNRNMAKANPFRNAVAQIRGGVHQDDFRKAIRNPRNRSHRDGPAPVVRDHRDVLQVEFFDELAQVFGAAVERIRILANRRFFRKPATDMVDGDRSIFPAKRLDNVAENERPSRVPVRH